MNERRVLLMYVHEFSGHHQAARALEKAFVFAAPGTRCLLVDAVRITHPILERLIQRAYLQIIKKKPDLWEYLYDNPRVLKSTASLRHSVQKNYSNKLDRLLKDFRPTDVVCTQAFPCGIFSDYKSVRHFKAPLYAVLTDYLPHSYWLAGNVERYFAASPEAGDKLAADGAPRERISVTGIPIDFPQKRGEIAARRGALRVLVMGGSQGIGPLEKVILSLDQLKENFEMTVLTGRNRKLFKKLSRLDTTLRKKTFFAGYTENILRHFQSADLLISKPGGLTIAQAMAYGLPLIFIDPIPGQEARNAAYLTAHKAALEARSEKEAAALVSDLLRSPEKIESLKKKMALLARPAAAADIAKQILSRDPDL